MELFLNFYAQTFFQESPLYVEEKFDKALNTIDATIQSIQNSKEWLYSFSENFFFYSYDINIYLYPLFEMIFNKDNSRAIFLNNFTGISSILFDTTYYIYVLSLPMLSKFFHKLVDDWDFTNIVHIHPEYVLIFKNYYYFYFNYFYGNLYPSVFLLNVNESFITPPAVVLQVIGIYFFVTLFITLYFNYFSNYVKEDNIIDHDYLTFNVTIEAEEEIGSLDDMLLASVILMYIFFWFFWIYSWSSCSIVPHFAMTIVLFPLLYFIILFVPVSLLYDYGSYFITYLNGVSKSSLLIVEFMFDLIAVSIFFLRLIVQNVRLIFMLFTYTELHEMIVFWLNNKNIFLFNDVFYESWEKLKTSFNLKNFSLIISAPLAILNWLYELFHTFFMLIFQFIAFFAMVFWLFLFLYSMFVSENQETYFYSKRKDIKEKQKRLYNFKNKVLNLSV